VKKKNDKSPGCFNYDELLRGAWFIEHLLPLKVPDRPKHGTFRQNYCSINTALGSKSLIGGVI
jgi:hypothetical protein